MAPIPRLKAYSGPAILSYGFRPFFLLGSFYAGLAVLAWLPMFYGEIEVASGFAPRDWHVHEMLYGYVPAIVTGFLLTAIPNWTGRLPLQGAPLLGLVAAWLLGRIAVTLSAQIGWLPALVLDGAFLTLVLAATGREIAAGRNWRNLKVLGGVALLLAGNLLFHVEARFAGAAPYGTRVGLAAVVMLLMLIGGRIIPSFTRNWLARQNPGRLPAPFGRFDAVSLAAGGLALVAWVAAPEGMATAALLALAALLQCARLARWAGERTFGDALVLILHVAYGFIPIGYGLLALAAVGLVPPAAGIHAWAGGAVGTMTIAVMSRASLGHTGRPLRASALVQGVYVLLVVSALARICAALHPAWSFELLHVAAFGWALAFVGFAGAYWAVLTSARQT